MINISEQSPELLCRKPSMLLAYQMHRMDSLITVEEESRNDVVYGARDFSAGNELC